MVLEVPKRCTKLPACHHGEQQIPESPKSHVAARRTAEVLSPNIAPTGDFYSQKLPSSPSCPHAGAVSSATATQCWGGTRSYGELRDIVK